jgi:REP element-mobilizing transposase RayT
MIIASHVVITAYGFWLPNDPRGSWSDFVRNWELYCYGRAIKVKTIRKARHARDDERRNAMKRALRYPALKLTGTQALWVGRAFAKQVTQSGFQIYACAILPCHAHLVIARHRYHVEQVTNLLKGAATRTLIERGCIRCGKLCREARIFHHRGQRDCGRCFWIVERMWCDRLITSTTTPCMKGRNRSDGRL